MAICPTCGHSSNFGAGSELVLEAHKIMATTNVDYDRAVELACNANPALAARYKAENDRFYFRG